MKTIKGKRIIILYLIELSLLDKIIVLIKTKIEEIYQKSKII